MERFNIVPIEWLGLASLRMGKDLEDKANLPEQKLIWGNCFVVGRSRVRVINIFVAKNRKRKSVL